MSTHTGFITMAVLAGKRVLLGITGGIAAYKSAELARLLVKAGAEVQVVMTRSAMEFITPLTLQALTGRPVRHELFDPSQEAAIGHIQLARWADLVLVAPATADFIARISHGLADDLLSTLILATGAPVALAPAMNRLMWENPATRDNLARVTKRGVLCWGPAEGEQACGEEGSGRMLEPPQLAALAAGLFASGPMKGLRILITAGPTREPIDPVRFVGNRSSGKMGYTLAEACAALGAEVTLVSGPVALEPPRGIARVSVETALEMHRAVLDRVGECDIFIGCAAVADYRPAQAAEGKIKKHSERLELGLVRNPDILADVAGGAEPPFTVGFAAETGDPAALGEAKRVAKRVKMIAANRVGGETGGFERDENELIVLWEGGSERLPMESKQRLAQRLAGLISRRYDEERHSTENT